jgi:N-methylhydantoinase A
VLATEGFEDVLTLGRQNRRDLYAPVVEPQLPRHLFPRDLRAGVAGRIDAAGRELHALDEGAVRAWAQSLRARGTQAVAVCFINAHANPVHERRARALSAEEAPALYVSLSSEVDARMREFERFLATALDAYAKPIAAAYLDEFVQGLHAMGLPEPEVMRAECGTCGWREAVTRPLQMAMCGPAAALAGVAAHAPDDVQVALDIGGTTSDIGLVENGEPASAQVLGIGAFELRMRCADVSSIAVGGGSIAAVVEGAGLRVGPRSQGAYPGPAAYGRGGKQATVTDALLVCGRLPASLAGGLQLQAGLAQRALADLAGQLGGGIEQAAQAVLEIVATAIAEGLKTHLYTRGVAPADCTLVAGGGGGAQHAAEVAERAGIARVRVLPQAGVIAAHGLLVSPATHSEECVLDLPLDDTLDAPGLATRAQALRPPAWAGARSRWRLEASYAGQEAPVEIDYRPGEDDAAALERRFEARHRQLRGHAGRGTRRLRRLRLELSRAITAPVPGGGAPDAVWGGSAPSGIGPRVLFAPDTTVWVPAGWSWRVDADASLWLTREAHDA